MRPRLVLLGFTPLGNQTITCWPLNFCELSATCLRGPWKTHLKCRGQYFGQCWGWRTQLLLALDLSISKHTHLGSRESLISQFIFSLNVWARKVNKSFEITWQKERNNWRELFDGLDDEIPFSAPQSPQI